MPSSLTQVLPKALEYSSRPPESVCGTINGDPPHEAFLGSMESIALWAVRPSYSPLGLKGTFVRIPSAYRLEPPLRLGGRPILLRPSLFQRITTGTGILTCCPSTTPFGLALGCRLTLGGQPFPRKPWTYGQEDSHLLCRYSCQHTHFHAVQHPSRDTFSPHGTLPYRSTCVEPKASVLRLAPLHLRRRFIRPVSYYAFFKG